SPARFDSADASGCPRSQSPAPPPPRTPAPLHRTGSASAARAPCAAAPRPGPRPGTCPRPPARASRARPAPPPSTSRPRGSARRRTGRGTGAPRRACGTRRRCSAPRRSGDSSRGGPRGARGRRGRWRRADSGKRRAAGRARRGLAGRSAAAPRRPPGPAASRARSPASPPPGGAGTRRAASCTGPAPTRSSCPQNSASAAFPPAGAAKTPYRPAADFHIVTTVETPTTPAALELRRREVLRQASVALAGRTVALWEVSPSAQVVPVLVSATAARPADTRLDLDSTLHRWSAPIIQGSRWVGCRLDNGDGAGPWCVAPVRQQPPAPPPNGVERRSRERMTLELAGLCLGLLDHPVPTNRPRRAEPDALLELARQPAVIAHEVANPLTAALAAPDLTRPLARQRGVALQGLVTVSNVFLQGDPNALYQVVTNLIRNAVGASLETRQPVVVTLEQAGELLRLAVEDRGVGIPAEHLERIFEPGFTTREFGSGSGTGLTVVSQITRDMFGGGVEVRSTVGRGATFTVNLPIPPQRTPRRRQGRNPRACARGQ